MKLLEVHEEAINQEEDDNVQGQDSIDFDVHESEEEIENKAVTAKDKRTQRLERLNM